MGNERRRHPRVKADLPFRLVSEAGEQEAFDLVDLSESGARIQCGHPITAMTRIRVALRIPAASVGRAEDVQLDTTGVVVWSHRIDEGRYDTGVFFADLAEDDRGVIQTFVDAAG